MNVQCRLLNLHDGVFQPDDYLARWCSPPIAEMFDRYAVHLQPGVAGGLERHTYVLGVYGPGNCIRNAMHFATVNPGVSPWWCFALYFEEGTFVWWMHSFCLSADGRTLFDPTVPPKNAPPDSPQIFVGIPWCWELYSLLLTTPAEDPEKLRQSLPWFLSRGIFSASPSLLEKPLASST